MLSAPRPLPPTVKVQPLLSYADIDMIERRVNSNVKTVINADMEKMKRMMTK